MPEQEQQQQQQNQEQSQQQQQQQTTDWKSSLSPEVQKVIETKGWKTPEDVVNGYGELERMVGQDKIPAPRKDKDGNFEKGELERYLTAVGLPKDAKEYKMPAEIKLPEGSGLTVAQLESFKPIAHKYGLLPHQFAGIMNEFANLVNAGSEAQISQENTKHDESVAALRQELGDQYDAKVALANRVLRSFVDKQRADSLVKKYGNDPDIIKLLANVGDNMSEEALDQSGLNGMGLTPDQAEAEIKKIRADAGHPYFVATHADHNYWVKRMDQLYKIAGTK